jgi:tetratricopeptide (TPR) repeat protein
MFASYADMHEVFKKNRSQILKYEVIEIDGFMFSTGIASIRSNSANSKALARVKAKHNAKIGFIKFRYPDHSNKIKYNTKLQDIILDEFFKIHTEKIILRKLIHVSTVIKNKKVKYVLGCPVKDNSLLSQKYTWKYILEYLRNSYRVGKPLRKDLYVEIALPENGLVAEKKFTDYLRGKFGGNLQKIISEKLCDSFYPELNLKINKLDIDNFTINKLLFLLNDIPYNPKLCETIGHRLKGNGFYKCALLFLKASLICPDLLPGFNKQCSIKNNYVPVIKHPVQKLLSLISETLWQQIDQKAKFENISLNKIKKALGKIPAGYVGAPKDKYFNLGQDLFFTKNYDLKKAYSAYESSVANNLSADGCNMAGNCARLLKRSETAILLLLQAVKISPKHKYAWIHLANAFIDINQKRLAEYCIKEAQKCSLDEWGQHEVKIITQKAKNN